MLERGWPFAVAVPVFVCRITNDAASEVDLRIPVNRKAHPDDLATILKRVSPFKELANKAATFRQARYRALEELKTARRVETDKRLGKSCYVRRTLAPAEKPGSEVVTKARHKSKFQTGEVCDKKPRHESWICL